MSGADLSGGDLLTWGLLLGVGGFAAWRLVGGMHAPAAAASTAAPATSAPPAGPVVTTSGGNIVQPGAPTIVGGGSALPTVPGTGAVPTLPVAVVASSVTGATLRATETAQLRWSGTGFMTTMQLMTLGAGMQQTYTFPAAAAVLEVLNSAGQWVAVASPGSPNTQPAVVSGSPLLTVSSPLIRSLFASGWFRRPVTLPVQGPEAY